MKRSAKCGIITTRRTAKRNLIVPFGAGGEMVAPFLPLVTDWQAGIVIAAGLVVANPPRLCIDEAVATRGT